MTETVMSRQILEFDAEFDTLLADVTRFVREEAIPRENEIEQADQVPADLVERMRGLGYFGWSIPRDFGGAGLSTEQLVRGAFALSQASVAFRARVGTNTGIGSEALVADGTDDQKQRYLPLLASGVMTGAFALTEPDAGSDATALQTTARRDGDHYVLDGSKCFITNAPIADLFTVMARTDPSIPGASGISAFLVERAVSEDGAGRFSCWRRAFRRVPGAGGEPDRRSGRAGISHDDESAEQAAHPLGRAMHGSRYPHARRSGRLYVHARAVRQASLGLPARAGADRRMSDGDLRRPLDDSRHRAQTRCRRGRRAGSVDVQDVCLRDVRAGRGPGRADARWTRLSRGQCGGTVLS